MQVQQQAIAALRGAAQSSRKPVPRISRLGSALVSARARFAVFAGFLLLVALTGGSSRPDVASLMVLRPAAVLFAGYAWLVASPSQLGAIRVPLLVVAGLMLVTLLQLVPLPVAIWTGLPHRDDVLEAGGLAGMGDLPRPLSFDPSRTWNTFFALIVPLAAILLAGIQERGRVIPSLMAVGLLSVLLGFLQAVGGGGLVLYDITHRGFPVGLFANKNHQAVLLLWLMMAASWFVTVTDPRRLSSGAAIGGALAVILVLFPLLVLTGSRAGLALYPLVLLVSGWLLYRSPAAKSVVRGVGKRARAILVVAGACLVAPLLFVFAVLWASGRQTALSRLFELEAAEDLRWQFTPTFLDMARDFLPFGSGFGSFEKLFRSYEPANMLTTRYMNQVHNDWLQLVIEGGIPALTIALVALLWLLRSTWRVWRSAAPGAQAHAAFLGCSILLWLIASVVDYPLRTPLGAALVAALTAQLSMLSTALRSGSRGLDSREPAQAR